MAGVAASTDTFRAVADPTRRAMLDMLLDADRTVSELAEPFRMTQPAISQHLRILRDAGLVRRRHAGRQSFYRANSRPIGKVFDWAKRYQLTDPFGHVWVASSPPIHVRDQQRARVFYTQKLGFEVRSDKPIELAPKGGQTTIVLFPTPNLQRPESRFSGVVFNCVDLEATYRELSARGVHFLEKPVRHPWGGILARFEDPDGNTFILTQE